MKKLINAMLLKFYIGKLLIEQTEIDFSEMRTCQEREQHAENIAAEMYCRHRRKTLIAARDKVNFFIDRVPSKMNYETA